MRDFFSELSRRDRVLATLGWFLLVLFAAGLVASFLDSRTVMGLNTWIKPMKFSLSLAIYVWTVTWFIGYFKNRPRWAITLIRWGVTLSLLLEVGLIFFQAARGTTSHFNVSTAFDGIIFGLMGNMIAIDVVLIFLLLVLFFVRAPALPKVYLWAIRLGLMVFLLGSWIGGVMIGQMAHTVGAPDGGPGLPLMNWSTQAGDLRIAHSMGLHGMQLIPLIGFGITRLKALRQESLRLGFLAAATAAYAGVTLFLFWQAKSGMPLISTG